MMCFARLVFLIWRAQVGKKKWRCELDGKEFSTMNILRAHFVKNYKDQALEWFEQQGGMDGGEQASASAYLS